MIRRQGEQIWTKSWSGDEMFVGVMDGKASHIWEFHKQKKTKACVSNRGEIIVDEDIGNTDSWRCESPWMGWGSEKWGVNLLPPRSEWGRKKCCALSNAVTCNMSSLAHFELLFEYVIFHCLLKIFNFFKACSRFQLLMYLKDISD